MLLLRWVGSDTALLCCWQGGLEVIQHCCVVVKVGWK